MTSPADAAAAASTAPAASAPSAGTLADLSSTTVLAFVCVLGVIFFAGWVLLRLPKADDIETQKVRFAAATFTGIMTVFVFAAALYFLDARAGGPGKDIFDKAMTAMTPLIGVIVGYLFGTKDKTASPTQEKKKEENAVDVTVDRANDRQTGA